MSDFWKNVKNAVFRTGPNYDWGAFDREVRAQSKGLAPQGARPGAEPPAEAFLTLIARIGAPAVPVLEQAKQDADPSIRAAAKLALDQLRHKAAPAEPTPEKPLKREATGGEGRSASAGA